MNMMAPLALPSVYLFRCVVEGGKTLPRHYPSEFQPIAYPLHIAASEFEGVCAPGAAVVCLDAARCRAIAYPCIYGSFRVEVVGADCAALVCWTLLESGIVLGIARLAAWTLNWTLGSTNYRGIILFWGVRR